MSIDVGISAPSPTLSSALWGLVTTADLIAPLPSLVVEVYNGSDTTAALGAPAPLLVVEVINRELITFAGTAPVPGFSASLAAGNTAAVSMCAPVPLAGIAALSGNSMTAVLAAATPIMAAAGYPEYVLTFAGSAPAPRLTAALEAAVVANYRTWVLNTRKGSLTEYTNFSFNSYAVFGGQVYACGAGGLVWLGAQALDGATAISARVRSGKYSYGSSLHKRVPRAYYNGSAAGDLYFRTITVERGTHTYLLPSNGGTGTQQRRIPVGKGPRSRYFQFEVENVAGSDFDLDSLLIYPQFVKRRVA